MEFEKFVAEMAKISGDSRKMTKDAQLSRLLSCDASNPYEVLEVGYEASDVELKRKYRLLSILVHPDKNKHERAKDAFHTLEKAYKTLADPEKRRMYQRVMREARERVEERRARTNDKRMLAG